MNKLSVVVVDDEELIATALRALCEKIAGVEVVAQTSNPVHGLDIVAELRPRLALVDLIMPHLNGIGFVSQLRQSGLPTRAIILTGFRDEHSCVQAMRAGAAGYLLKVAAQAELATALHAVDAGETYITPELSAAFMNRSCIPSDEHLTLRHRQVLQLIVDGKANKEIAGILNISVKTTEKHRAELMRRLQVSSIAELVSLAIRHRLVLTP
jgi:DNA-binding NarL/FixJ family response regulator